jgi:hypothetical protein
MQHGRVCAAGDDRLERQRVRASAEELRLQLDLQLALGSPRLDQRLQRCEAGACRLLRRPHPGQLDLVLRPANVREPVAELLVELRVRRDARHAGAEAAEASIPASFQPGVQFVHGPRAVRDAFFEPIDSRPEALLARHRFDEIGPAVLGVESEHAAGSLAVRQVEILRVRAKRVGEVVATRHRNRLARTDEHELVCQVPRVDRSRSPARELGDYCPVLIVQAPSGL